MTGDEHDEVRRRLDRAARAELAALLREGEALAGPELEAAARARLERTMEGRPRQARWLRLAVAAGSLGILVAFLAWRSETPREPHFVGEPGAAASLEAGRDAFTWDLPLPAGGHYELRLWDAAAPGGAEPLVETMLAAPRWEVDRPLPPIVRWELRIVADGRVERQAGGEARVGE